MAAGVVVDTTVWIDFFRGRNEQVLRYLRDLLKRHEVVLVGVVMAEVLQGIRSRSEQSKVEEHFAALRYIEATWETWRASAELARNLRHQGKTVPLSDLLVASIAIDNNLSVYSADSHFALIPDLALYETSN